MIAIVDDGELGMRPEELAAKLTGGSDAAPVWLSDVGEAEIIDAAVMRDDVFDDASTDSSKRTTRTARCTRSAC